MTKIVSQLDAQGYLIGLAIADESPLEPNVYLLPGGCVDHAPIDVPVGKRAKWMGESFSLEDAIKPPEPIEPMQPTQEEIIEAQRQSIRAQITALEYEQLMPRASREFMLLSMGKEAAAYAASISTPEATVTAAEVLALNYGYQAVKAFDNQIVALRAQL